MRRDCNGKCIELIEGHALEVVVEVYWVASKYDFNNITYGLVLDALNIIAGLGLNNVMTDVINNGFFQSKYSWKTLITSKFCMQTV